MVAAVYRHIGASGELLYVGCSQEPLRRQRQHATSSHWFGSVARIDLEWHEGIRDARAAENWALNFESPLHNKARESWGGRIEDCASAAMRSFVREKRRSPLWFAARLRCELETVRKWVSGAARPSPAYREKIERLTNGAVPASSWREAS